MIFLKSNHFSYYLILLITGAQYAFLFLIFSVLISVENGSHRSESGGHHLGRRLSHQWDSQRSKGKEEGQTRRE